MGKKTPAPRKTAVKIAAAAKPQSARDRGAPARKTAKAAQPAKRSVGRPRKNAAPLDPNDALGMLAADHRKVEQLFEEFEQSSDDDEKFDLAREVCRQLVMHTEIEERIFYPACRQAIDDEDMLDEAQVEHDSAKLLIIDILDSEPGDPFYDAKVQVLSEQIRHHVREEEQRANSIFSKAQKAGLDLKGLARGMKALKRDLDEASRRGALPKPRPRSLRVAGAGGARMRDMERGQSERMRGEDEDYAASGRMGYGDDRRR